jgi:GDP-L-fucose synthase
MRALVTGGAGFVGRHLCRALLDEQWDVVCLDPIVPLSGGLEPHAWPLFDPTDYRQFRFVKADCRAYFVDAAREHFDYVFHLAAIVGGRLMIEYDPLAVAEDLAIDAAYWRWAKAAKPSKSVVFSSSAAYPIALQREGSFRLLRESDVDLDAPSFGMPDMTYGWAKLTGEYLARLAFERHGLRSVVYRPFSGYGEDQASSYPFIAIANRILELEAPVVTVWGSGRQMRDFIHVDDCVRCVLSTMDRVDDGSAVNVSSGTLTSFIDLARLLLARVGKRATVRSQSDMPEGVFARGGDTRLQRELGFEPSIALTEGVDRVVAALLRTPMAA